MNLDKAGHQMSTEQVELPLETRGASPTSQRSGEAASAVLGPDSSGLRDRRCCSVSSVANWMRSW